MSTIYRIELLMLAITLAILAIPFLLHKPRAAKSFFVIGIFTILLSISLYQSRTDTFTLNNWLTEGQEHYELIEKFNDLGGVEGAIAKVKQKLVANPGDIHGWEILDKLYLSKNDYVDADMALNKIKELQKA